MNGQGCSIVYRSRALIGRGSGNYNLKSWVNDELLGTSMDQVTLNSHRYSICSGKTFLFLLTKCKTISLLRPKHVTYGPLLSAMHLVRIGRDRLIYSLVFFNHHYRVHGNALLKLMRYRLFHSVNVL